MRVISIIATFGDLPAAHAEQAASARASSIPTGVKRALDKIFRRPEVKGRRIKVFRVGILVGPNLIRADKAVAKDGA